MQVSAVLFKDLLVLRNSSYHKKPALNHLTEVYYQKNPQNSMHSFFRYWGNINYSSLREEKAILYMSIFCFILQ